MGKKKKKARTAAKGTQAAENVAFRPLQGALSELKEQLRAQAEKPQKTPNSEIEVSANASPSPSSTRPRPRIDQKSYDARMALQQAYQGVKPLRGSAKGPAKRVAPTPDDAPQTNPAARIEAMRPVQQLVADGVRFVIEVDDGGSVRAHRASVGKQTLERLKGGHAVAEASLDLHGFREQDARQMLQRWLGAERKRGRRVVRVVHGKGNHSAGGAVLKDAVRDELERGLCAAFVDAFMTASLKHGGQGALLLLLRRR